MSKWLLLALCLCAVSACGPTPEEGTPSGRGATAGMCPSCGCTSFDVERHTERSEQTGEPKEYLQLTCRDCGHSWRAPTLAEQKDW